MSNFEVVYKGYGKNFQDKPSNNLAVGQKNLMLAE